MNTWFKKLRPNLIRPPINEHDHPVPAFQEVPEYFRGGGNRVDASVEHHFGGVVEHWREYYVGKRVRPRAYHRERMDRFVATLWCKKK